ncbi:DUF1353 domain-containing protein [Lysobacter sp. 2RAF19]
MDQYRRTFLLSTAAVAATMFSRQTLSQDGVPVDTAKRDFIKRINEEASRELEIALAAAKEMEKRGVFASLMPPQQLVPFKDWDYYYLKGMPSVWSPNPGQKYKRVVVPVGFVTDLTSVPQWVWSSGIRPEGPYAFAAIIHDYLYWTQERPKAEADEIFLFAMQDSKVDKKLRDRIYTAVKNYGGNAWVNNAKLKKAGERRILRRFPDDFTVSWQEWKRQPGVF